MRKNVFLAAGFVVASTASLSTFAHETAAPRDVELARLLTDHRSQFDRLRVVSANAARAKGYFRSSADLSALSASAAAQYRRDLKVVGRELEIYADGTGDVRFILYVRGTSAIGPTTTKGVEYFPANSRVAGSVVNDTDNAKGIGVTYLKKISARWYVFKEIQD